MGTSDTEKHWDGPDLTAWEPWSPQQVWRLLHRASAPWCVVGGWAIDLWLGRDTRPHGDIEVAIPRTDFGHLRKLLEPGHRLHAAGSGETFALDVNEPMQMGKHQCWVSDPAHGKWRLDLMLEPGDHRTWVFRRDVRIRRPRQEMVEHSGTIPFLRPEGVLLYKAKACRDKDEADFETCLPGLSEEARTWLVASLAVVHPGHDWMERLRR